ncbi:M57 family metalloprotease [Myxococcota bacterium]|nr:M57 family metalloprotease [Myxococcota bacterium]
MMLRGSLAFAFVGAVSLTACGGSETAEQPETFEEFQGLVYQEPDTGIFVFNGDEIAEDLTQLREGFARYQRTQLELEEQIGQSLKPLAVNRVNGADDKWPAATAANLTYCIDQRGFGSRYNTVVSALASAAQDWEQSARVNFVHASADDARCNSRTNVVFNVRQVCSGQYLARAFFPSSNRRSRELLIDCTSFGNISPWTLTGVLRHELGHTIGFRHEHTRPESGTCFEDNNWRALTAYDSSSVMHYPQCNGTQNGDLVLTSADRQGAGALYP